MHEFHHSVWEHSLISMLFQQYPSFPLSASIIQKVTPGYIFLGALAKL